MGPRQEKGQPVTLSRQLLMATSAAALCAAPLLAFGQAPSPQPAPPASTAPANPAPGAPMTTAPTPAPAMPATPRAAAPATPSATTTSRAPDTTTGATGSIVGVDNALVAGGRRASRVIGSNVYNEQNESIGEVDDIIIPQGATQPVAILSVGGFLGIGARLVAVPYDRLQHATDRDRWMLQGATKDSLRALPEFTYEGDTVQRRG